MNGTHSCWFCDQGSASEKHAVRTPFWRDAVPAPNNQIAFPTTTALVPRCPACARVHGFALFFTVILFLIGGLAGVLVYGAMAEWLGRVIGWSVLVGALFIGFGVVGGALGIMLGSPLAKAMHRGRRTQDYEREHPNVRQLVAEGWTLGVRPSRTDLANSMSPKPS